jgi:hypothetical protein
MLENGVAVAASPARALGRRPAISADDAIDSLRARSPASRVGLNRYGPREYRFLARMGQSSSTEPTLCAGIRQDGHGQGRVGQALTAPPADTSEPVAGTRFPPATNWPEI